MPDRTDIPFSADSPTASDFPDDEQALFLPDDDYRIRLAVFEGPIDLLLYLIRKRELDIHEIPLADIIREYMEYVELLKLIDIERAGDFIVMASTLMKIKSRSLFASPSDEEDDEAGNDPRQTLIKYLMEFEKFGGVAEMLAEKEEERRSVFPRGGEKNRAGKFVEETPPEPDFELFDLLTALKEVLKTAPKEATHKVEILNVTSEMKQREILDALEQEGKIDFVAYVKGRPKIIIVVTFIAMLELIKLRKIRVRQSGQFKRIVIVKRDITDEPPIVMDDTGDLNDDDVNYNDVDDGGIARDSESTET